MMKFKKLQKLLLHYFAESRWYTLAILTLFYTVSSWLLMALAGETALTQRTDFIYWLAVTGSTVGYGDLSPVTDAGKLIVAFYVIPLGLSIFALVLGRIAAWVGHQWQKGILGMKPLNTSNHILVIGWNEQRTIMLLNLLLKERDAMESKPDIVLCVKADIQNPLPGKVDFVKVESFNKDEDMSRACVADAQTIIIDNPQDDATMTTALYCAQANKNAHKVAYFKDDSLAKLLQTHCPKVECTPSVAVEMLAKAALDPGSSLLHHDLLSVEDGQAQFSSIVPDANGPITVDKVFVNLKRQHDATFIGYSRAKDGTQMVLNPTLNDELCAGDRVFYIAKKRVTSIDWTALGAQ